MDAKSILKSVKLPTLSRSLYELIDLEKRNPISYLQDVKKVVEMDPLLSAHLLKVANSPLYGFAQQVKSLSHAIGLLGARRVRSIAFTFSIFDFLKNVKFQPKFGSLFQRVIKKTLLLSSVSTVLARKVEYMNPDELYVGALLADIGQLVLCLHAPDKYFLIYSPIDADLVPNERDIFDTDHVELGMEMCKQWNFPTFFQTIIKEHYILDADDGNSKVAFISNRITEFLLTEDEDKKAEIFKAVEDHTKKLLHLSISDVEETIKQLPSMMDVHIKDFPEVQKDLENAIQSGASLILRLMKREMESITRSQELADSHQKLAKEKMFLSHMLNLSYFLSSLVSPRRIISSLFEYFDNFITDFTIEFIHRRPDTDEFFLLTEKDDPEGEPIRIDQFDSLLKARISNEAVQLETDEAQNLEKSSQTFTLVFPISYHNNFFGYLMLSGDKKNYLSFDMEMSYVQILANIIANSFQNYASFQDLKNETNKKEMVTRELFKFDRELDESRRILIQLQKSEIVSEMLPVIFHKLKNKLTPILGYSQILIAKVQDENLLKRIRKIEKNANELTEQLNHLRDYFGRFKVSSERENLNSIIEGLKPYFKELEESEKIKITLELDHDISTDRLIPGQIESLVTHLVDNAVSAITAKSGDRDGNISITTRADDKYYSLTVRDNGMGIMEDNIPLIWSPFYSEFSGKAGLGLSICEKILTNHEATFEIKSAIGKYTEFTVTFTNRLFDMEGKAPPLLPDQAELHGRIMIVDDEAYLVQLMKEILMKEGSFDIVTTTSGSEAVRLLDNTFDLVISDIHMPDVDGMEIFDFLKSKKMERQLVMVTEAPLSPEVSDFLRENEIDYLKKPFELMEFKKRVIDKLS